MVLLGLRSVELLHPSLPTPNCLASTLGYLVLPKLYSHQRPELARRDGRAVTMIPAPGCISHPVRVTEVQNENIMKLSTIDEVGFTAMSGKFF